MQRSRNQQLNSETTNIVRHINEEKKTTHLEYRTLMIAPVIHIDVADFFQYHVHKGSKIIPISIERATGLIDDSNTISELNANYDAILCLLASSNDCKTFVDEINNYKMAAT